MEQYTKPDKYYVDNYDRETIAIIAGLEKGLSNNYKIEFHEHGSDLFELMGSKIEGVSKLYHTAFRRAESRKSVIDSWKQSHMQYDMLVKKHPVLSTVVCNSCGNLMIFETYLFKDTKEEEILFAYSCSKHAPKKIVYPNGKEYKYQVRKCDNCSGKLDFKTEMKGTLLILTNICLSCGKIEVCELDGSFDDAQPIDENERLRCCIQFEKIAHFFDDLLLIEKFAAQMEKDDAEKNLKKVYEVDKIKKINVPALEVFLKKETEKSAYTKFEFTKTELTKFAVVTFAMLDPTDRNGNETLKQAAKIINKTLFDYNWRLISNSLTYRLGIVTGRIKAYETEDDLLRLAKSIKETKTKK